MVTRSRGMDACGGRSHGKLECGDCGRKAPGDDAASHHFRAQLLLKKYTAGFSLPQASSQEIMRLQRNYEGMSGREVVLIDVRTDAERAVSMLPNAVSREDFERASAIDPQRYASATLVPYCTIGFRSGHYCNRLRSSGATDVRNGGAPSHPPAHACSSSLPRLCRNADGVVLWSHDAGCLAPPAARGAAASSAMTVRRLHVYGAEWDAAADDFETIRFGIGGQTRGALSFASERVISCFFSLCSCCGGHGGSRDAAVLAERKG